MGALFTCWLYQIQGRCTPDCVSTPARNRSWDFMTQVDRRYDCQWRSIYTPRMSSTSHAVQCMPLHPEHQAWPGVQCIYAQIHRWRCTTMPQLSRYSVYRSERNVDHNWGMSALCMRWSWWGDQTVNVSMLLPHKDETKCCFDWSETNKACSLTPAYVTCSAGLCMLN